jgi:uncharacterized membrane protein
MFQLLFRYPIAVYSKGEWIFTATWPRWLLLLLIGAAIAGLGLLTCARAPKLRNRANRYRLLTIWLLQSALATVLLFLLWKPVVMVAELKAQQNIVAVLVDDSRSMAVVENGLSRETRAVRALQGGVLNGISQRFQIWLYRLDGQAAKIARPDQLQATAPLTRIGASLKQLSDETAGLPLGAVVLLSDGSDNAGNIDKEAIAALRSRHIPVHTVGFGREQLARDVELEDVDLPSQALANARIAAVVRFRQRGYSGRKGLLTIRDDKQILASLPLTFGADGDIQTETELFNAGPAGTKTFQFLLDPFPDEENAANNALGRLVNVEAEKRKILYVEGEPRWEYKFIRRAEQDDQLVQMSSLLRTTENKIYRQGIGSATELAEGFPAKAEELFAYQGLVIGSVEASYFTPEQQELIREFVDRRGGGLLLLGGRWSLADGGWATSRLADLTPLGIPSRKGTFHRDPATVALTPAGEQSIICRLADDSGQNRARWKKLPYLMDYQEAGTPKPGATVLAEMKAAGRSMPLLVTQNFGRGRVGLLATGGTWRWQMNLPAGDPSHQVFWQQLLRWLVADAPGNVRASASSYVLQDDGVVRISAEVRDREFLPATDAQVEATISQSDGRNVSLAMLPNPNSPGVYEAEWRPGTAGMYTTEVKANRGREEIGRDTVTFQRVDGIAENFHIEQNRELLEKLAFETGGNYWLPENIGGLPAAISYSEAGMSIREPKPLWTVPAVFLVLVTIRCAEWLLRRKWGMV